MLLLVNLFLLKLKFFSPFVFKLFLLDLVVSETIVLGLLLSVLALGLFESSSVLFLPLAEIHHGILLPRLLSHDSLFDFSGVGRLFRIICITMVIVRGWDAVGWIGGAVGLGVPPHVVEVVHLPLFVVLEEPLIGAKVLRLLAVEALGDLVE